MEKQYKNYFFKMLKIYKLSFWAIFQIDEHEERHFPGIGSFSTFTRRSRRQIFGVTPMTDMTLMKSMRIFLGKGSFMPANDLSS